MRTLDPAAVARRGLRAFTYQVVMPRRRAGAGRDARRVAASCSRAGAVRSSRTGSGATASTPCSRSAHEWREARRHAPVRNRRRRHQARRPGAARAARHDGEVPALGRRVQVPGRAGHDAAAADRRQRRPHRRGDAVRRARARAPRRHDGRRWRRCTTSRKSRARDIRDGDLVARREGRRHHPEGGRARARASGRPDSQPWQMPTSLPVLRQRARQARGRSRLALRERVVPGAHAPRPAALRVAARDEHRRPRRVARRSARHRGPRARLRRPLRARRRTRSPALERMGKKSAANLVAEIDKSRQRRALAAAPRHRHPARRRGRRAGAGARVRLDAGAPARVGRSARGRAGRRARSSRDRCARSSTSRATPTLLDRLAAAACGWKTTPDGATRPGPAPLAGQTFVITGTLESMSREAGGRGASRRWAAKSAGRSAERRPGVVVGPTRAASSRRRGRWACPCSMRRRFWPL